MPELIVLVYAAMEPKVVVVDKSGDVFFEAHSLIIK